MDDRPVARDGLGRLDPDVFLEVGRDPEVDVGNDPLGRARSRSRGARKRRRACRSSSPRKTCGGPAVLGVAQRRALIDPGQERGALLGRQAAVVDEMAIARIGVPGGHPALVDHLADHRRMLSGIVIGQERERPDLAGPVAGLALVLDDRGDVRGVRDLAHLDRVFLFASRQ